MFVLPRSVSSFTSFSSESQRVHVYQTATGLRFVMVSDLKVAELNQHLLYIYKNVYVEYVAKNPLSVYTPVVKRKAKFPNTNAFTHGEITCALFKTQLNRYLSSCGLMA